MTERDPPQTLVCEDLDLAIALFARLGLRLDTISPADDPSVALLSGPAARVRLVRAGSVVPPDAGDGPRDASPILATAIARSDSGRAEPATDRPALVVVRAGDSPWRTGRAGMLYRDLIPDRQGGRVIASHIRIPDGGPVPDYVHFHAIELQLIYCYRGWVRVVYEDQGEPFVLAAGDCVLQPPQIRHRVLEASAGLEVIELGVPAVHATHVDHDRALPTPELRPERNFGGQRFVHFRAETARFTASPIAGLEACELGIAAATGGRAAVHVLRVTGPLAPRAYRHAGELLFHVVLRGELTLAGTAPPFGGAAGRGAPTLDGTHRLAASDAFVVPAGQPFTWTDASPDLSLLSVALPDTGVTPAD
jgi:quercetin dioxygenase-like cupin family protein